MSEEMPSSWRYLNSASSRLSFFRDYLQRGAGSPSAARTVEAPGGQQSWKAWAGQKVKFRRGPNGREGLGTETISLFPGWAARRYQKTGTSELEEAFEVEVFISGFASSHRSPEFASRSQRAFMRLAKGFASLPKITADAISPESESLLRLSPSTEALLAQIKLPPRPTEITEDYEIEALERHFQRANATLQDCNTPSSSRSSSVESIENIPDVEATPRPPPQQPYRNPATAIPADALRKLHANLESRLQPFWSSVLPSRTIRLHLFASPHQLALSKSLLNHKRSNSEGDRDAINYGPMASQDVLTSLDGSFQARFRVKWEDLCQHPGALHIAFGDRIVEHELLIAAQLLPPPSPVSSDSESDHQPSTPPNTPPSTIRISITHSPIRVISDIDDTVKLSNILSGARAVFHNVFVKDLKDNIIPGMGEWYSAMWSRGIRFHYVSNGPFELLPVLNEFLQISQLPPGSIKLKSYAGRSFFNGLLSAPAIRKRVGVVDILDSFPESRFLLIGDTGEQDLELYADLARERPHQILAVLVRDVEAGDPIDDPTGWKAVGATGKRNDLPVRRATADDTIRPRRTLSDMLNTRSSSKPSASSTPITSRTDGGEFFTTSQYTSEPEPISMNDTFDTNNMSSTKNANAPASSSRFGGWSSRPASLLSQSSKSSTSSSSASRVIDDAEKRRQGLQMRVYRARTQMPGDIPLRIFRDPADCVEVDEILERESTQNTIR